MGIQDRLREFINYKHLTYRAFEQKCNFGNGTAKRFNETIKKRTLNSISEQFPELNIDWLLYGEGNMLRSNPDPPKIYTSEDEIPPGVKTIPLLNLDVRGGYDNNDVADNEFQLARVPWQNAYPGDFATQVSGSSMMPNIMPGSIVVLREVPDWLQFLELNQLYVIELNDGRRILKLVNASDRGDEFVKLTSFNPDSPDQNLPLAIVKKVYKVIGNITRYGF